MFKNNNFALIQKLENRVSVLRETIAEAEFRQSDDLSYYQNALREALSALAVASVNYASEADENPLVYSC